MTLPLTSARLVLVSDTPVIWLDQPPAMAPLLAALTMDEKGCGTIAATAPLNPYAPSSPAIEARSQVLLATLKP